MDKKKARQIIKILSDYYGDVRPQLNYRTDFELLVAVILSAQCTDKRVNIVTEQLFKQYNTPQHFAGMPQELLEKYIFSCGFYRSKAKHIIQASQSILSDYGGQVPKTVQELKKLSGVGQKTANVVYSVAFKGDAIAVDTHVFRVSNRLGLATAKNVELTEKQLNGIIDKKDWSVAHHLMIYHGRNICKSQRPQCGSCPVNSLCGYFAKNRTEGLKPMA